MVNIKKRYKSHFYGRPAEEVNPSPVWLQGLEICECRFLSRMVRMCGWKDSHETTQSAD